MLFCKIKSLGTIYVQRNLYIYSPRDDSCFESCINVKCEILVIFKIIYIQRELVLEYGELNNF